MTEPTEPESPKQFIMLQFTNVPGVHYPEFNEFLRTFDFSVVLCSDALLSVILHTNKAENEIRRKLDQMHGIGPDGWHAESVDIPGQLKRKVQDTLAFLDARMPPGNVPKANC